MSQVLIFSFNHKSLAQYDSRNMVDHIGLEYENQFILQNQNTVMIAYKLKL